ncbi:hypothetical protein ACIHDR_47880 [Nocardia sp. NPDC052278]|uniref:hypothetical protein n=1 Tax=unclassified Nocardia TaxID=2637762 RepID=UPI0036907F21
MSGIGRHQRPTLELGGAYTPSIYANGPRRFEYDDGFNTISPALTTSEHNWPTNRI